MELDNFGKGLRLTQTCVSFPLTLALSLREREQQGSLFGISNCARLADRLTAILPLPWGEGRDEGDFPFQFASLIGSPTAEFKSFHTRNVSVTLQA